MTSDGPQALQSWVTRLRDHQWSPVQRALFISAMAIAAGSLFVATYSLALGDPVPHRIPAALVGRTSDSPATINAVQRVANQSLDLRRYRSLSSALHAIDEQKVYAALDLTATRPTLYVASAAGASVARVMEKIYAVDPSVRVVDAHPLNSHDPSGVDIFYLMLVTTIVGFVTVFQVRANASELPERRRFVFVVYLALAGSLVLTVVDGPLLDRPSAAFPEEWAILAAHLLAVASFASVMTMVLNAWAILPTWLFFVVLGNASSGGAVSPALLPQPFAFLSQWLPSGATVTSLRNAIYFRNYQHVLPLAVLAAWALGLFAAWWLVAAGRQATTS